MIISDFARRHQSKLIVRLEIHPIFTSWAPNDQKISRNSDQLWLARHWLTICIEKGKPQASGQSDGFYPWSKFPERHSQIPREGAEPAF